jgi:hypothetical protein
MRLQSLALAAACFLISLPAAADAKGLAGLWRFDMVSSGGTTLGAMTIQTLETQQRQAATQHEWALAKGRGTEWKRTPGPLTVPSASDRPVYTGVAMTDQGTHGLPIESIELKGGAMTMVVNSPRGLVIFRGTINADQTRFDGKATYWNGSVFDMHGVKQEQPLPR